MSGAITKRRFAFTQISGFLAIFAGGNLWFFILTRFTFVQEFFRDRRSAIDFHPWWHTWGIILLLGIGFLGVGFLVCKLWSALLVRFRLLSPAEAKGYPFVRHW